MQRKSLSANWTISRMKKKKQQWNNACLTEASIITLKIVLKN